MILRSLAILAVLALSACSTVSPQGAGEAVVCTAEPIEAIYRANGQPLATDQALALLAEADYVLAGESHDNAHHHAVQARIVAALGRQGHMRNVYFEMLEPVHDPAVAAFLAGNSSIDRLEQATAWTERGWPVWQAYAPIFVAARDAGMHVSHGNPPRDLIRDINRQGFAAVPGRLREELRIHADGPFVIDFAAQKAEIGRHHPMPDEQTARFAASQYVKDAHMAARLARQENGILIAGRGHVRADLGVPAHLQAFRPQARIIAIGLVGEEAGSPAAARRVARENGRKLHDLVWFTGKPCPADAD